MYLAIIIEDTGVGIEESRKERIFHFSLNPSYGTDREKGIGLGLTICHDLVRVMGGKLTFTSEPGHGSCFKICLPLESRAAET